MPTQETPFAPAVMFTELSPAAVFTALASAFCAGTGAGRNVVAAGLAELFPACFEDLDFAEEDTTRESLFFKESCAAESSIIPAAAAESIAVVSSAAAEDATGGTAGCSEPSFFFMKFIIARNAIPRTTSRMGMVLEFPEAADSRILFTELGAEMSSIFGTESAE